MRIPVQDQVIVHIYRCGHCDKTFLAQTSNYKISCAVAHAPGTCCHYGEKDLNPEQMMGILGLLK